MRTLLFMPGGLELHIGVSLQASQFPHFALACLQGESLTLGTCGFFDMRQAVNHHLTHLMLPPKPRPCIYRCSSQH